MQFQVARARDYYRRGARGFGASSPPDGRAIFHVECRAYRGLLDEDRSQRVRRVHAPRSRPAGGKSPRKAASGVAGEVGIMVGEPRSCRNENATGRVLISERAACGGSAMSGVDTPARKGGVSAEAVTVVRRYSARLSGLVVGLAQYGFRVTVLEALQPARRARESVHRSRNRADGGRVPAREYGLHERTSHALLLGRSASITCSRRSRSFSSSHPTAARAYSKRTRGPAKAASFGSHAHEGTTTPGLDKLRVGLRPDGHVTRKPDADPPLLLVWLEYRQNRCCTIERFWGIVLTV